MTSTGTLERGTAPLDIEHAEQLRAWVEDDGEQAVIEALGLSRLSLARMCGGLPVHRATRELAIAALERRRSRR